MSYSPMLLSLCRPLFRVNHIHATATPKTNKQKKEKPASGLRAITSNMALFPLPSKVYAVTFVLITQLP